MTKVREFATGWGQMSPQSWTERDDSDIVGAGKGGHLFIPGFRPFDFLAGPNAPLTYLASISSRIAIDAPRGTEPHFHRNVDFDMLYLQWAGETSYETEYGVYDAKPGELMLIPGGTAHCATGSADSLRLRVSVRDPLEVLVDAEKHVGETAYRVTWAGGPSWPVPAGNGSAKNGKVLENLHTWDDKPGDETVIERDRARLVGTMTGGGGIHKIRLFDIFTEITGRRGPGPVSMKNDRFFVECYNTTGAQFAFHRGNRSEEFQFQFCGTAENISEFGTENMTPGDLALVRRGVSHRVIGSNNFRRIVLYGRDPWQVMIDPTKPLRRTRFDVAETVVDAAPWRRELETA
ncbi:MAG TPA: hypothetical protein VN802_22960 [Stellaceae bacterium]|nr:hypothetical protein [Stellaceae bacterium]